MKPQGGTKGTKISGHCFVLLVFLCGFADLACAQTTLVTDEAEAVLAILAKRKTNEPVTEADWQRVFQSEGYVRLKQRETGFHPQLTYPPECR